jgi:hypothetical protein
LKTSTASKIYGSLKADYGMKNLGLVGAIVTLLFCQCSLTHSLSQTEKAKLDPQLIRLLTGNQNDNQFTSSQRSDGTKEYAVIITSEHSEEIKSTGASVSSVFGDVIVARATIDELRKIVSLPAVRAIESGSKNTTQPRQDKELK